MMGVVIWITMATRSVKNISDTDPNGGRRPPAYRRISTELRRRVDTGLWTNGSLIPSRQALAREYNVDVSTVQRAIADLIDDGTFRADRGRGTFVARESRGEPVSHASGAPTYVSLSADNAPEDSFVPLPPLLPVSPVSAPVSQGKVGILCKMHNAADFWPRTVLHGLERVIAEAGGTTQFLNLSASLPPSSPGILPHDAARRMAEEGVHALAIVDIRDDWTEEEIVKAIAGFGGDASRVGVVSAVDLSLPVPRLLMDQHYAGYLAMRHLIERGIYRDVAFVAPFHRPWVNSRWNGTLQALRLSNLPGDRIRFFAPADTVSRKQPAPDESEALAFAASSAFLSQRQPFAAVIAANDTTALTFATVAKAEYGLEMGRDYALIGFDDDPFARDVGLTSLRPPLEELGREAGALLLRLMAGENASIETRLGSFLVPRASTQGVPTRLRQA